MAIGLRIALISAALMVFAAQPASAKYYRNSEYGIMLLLPKGLLVCREDPERHDHGPSILIGTSKQERL